MSTTTVPLSWFIFVIIANLVTILVAAAILLFEGKRLAGYYQEFRKTEKALNERIKRDIKTRQELAELTGRLALARTALKTCPPSDSNSFKIVQHAIKTSEAPFTYVD